MLKREWLEIRAMDRKQQLIEEVEEDIIKKIKKSEARDNEVIKAVKEMKKARVKVLRNEEWQIEGDLVLKQEKVYILRDEKLRLEIIWLCYNILITEHGGQWKIVKLVTKNYQWPRVIKEVKKYVKRCDQCQRMKNKAEMPAGKLRPNKVSEKPWQHISVDFITNLLVSKGYNLIFVVCDRFLKMSHFVMIIEKIMAERLARLFRDNVWKLHRLLESVISDKKPQFMVGLTRELNKMLEIETKLSTTYHPQTDGQIRRINQELKQYLRMYVNHRQNNQSEWLAMVKFAFNNKVHRVTKLSPFKVNYGRKPRIGFDIGKKGKNIKTEEFVKEIKNRHEEMKAALVKSQEEMKKQANRNRKEIEEYRVEEKVLIGIKDFPMELIKRETKKITKKYIEPYIVKKIISENTVELELLMSLRIHLVVNVRRIVKY